MQTGVPVEALCEVTHGALMQRFSIYQIWPSSRFAGQGAPLGLSPFHGHHVLTYLPYHR